MGTDLTNMEHHNIPRAVSAVLAATLFVVALVAVFSDNGTPPSTTDAPKKVASDTSMFWNPFSRRRAPAKKALACSQDTGGTCYTTSCYAWRKHATCSWGKCKCPSDRCAYQGSCLAVGKLPPKTTTAVCQPTTGEKCRFQKLTGRKCSGGAKCSGITFGFSSGISLGDCTCPWGKCASGGKCVAMPQFFKAPTKLESKKIICPVLASLHNAGIMKADAYGRVERLNVQAAIRDGLNADDQTAWFFGQTTAGYKNADIDEQQFMMEPLTTSLKLKKANATKELPGGDRFLNIFKMLENKDVLHQIGAAVRGGPIDSRCKTYPCAARFTEFFGKFATKDGKVYAKQLGQMAGYIFQNGYHGVAASSTLFTNLLGFTGREYLALAGFLACFGYKDAQGKQYFKIADLKYMEMNGKFPVGWKKHAKPWGGTDVNLIVNEWRKQKVPGVATSLKLRGLMVAMKGDNKALAKAFTARI